MLSPLTVKPAPTFGQEPSTDLAWPQRPIYDVANAYYHAYPYTNAFLRAMTTPGTRLEKWNAGSNELSYWLGFRAFNRLYDRAMMKLYRNHPALADQVNRHPIVFGIPFLVGGVLIGEAGGGLVSWAWRSVNERFLQNTTARVLKTKPVDWSLRTLQPVQRFFNHRWIKAGLGVLSIGFGLVFLGRMIQDAWTFGHRYKALHVRDTKPALDKPSLEELQVDLPLSLERTLATA